MIKQIKCFIFGHDWIAFTTTTKSICKRCYKLTDEWGYYKKRYRKEFIKELIKKIAGGVGGYERINS
jgi:hypothetical protein